MSKPLNRVYIDWEEFGILMDQLIESIKELDREFDGVFGIKRGGLPIAVVLSHYLRLPLVDTPTKDTLIVDDISDTGKTLDPYKDHTIACLFCSIWTKVIPNVYTKVKSTRRQWVVFPWENRV